MPWSKGCLEATVLDTDTPPIISMGNRCMDEGYSFIWAPYEHPKLITPTGRAIRLTVDAYVPHIDAEVGAMLAAAADSNHQTKKVACPAIVTDDNDEDKTHFPDSKLEDNDVEELDPTKVDATARQRKKSRPIRMLTPDQWAEHCVTHHPKEPGCPICARAKAQRQPRRKISDASQHEGFTAQKFGDTVTADHGFV